MSFLDSSEEKSVLEVKEKDWERGGAGQPGNKKDLINPSLLVFQTSPQV